jgi:PAS domain S-box-containing protein
MTETTEKSPTLIAMDQHISLEELPSAYFECDVDGTIMRCNQAARELHVTGTGDIIGSKIWTWVAHDQQAASRNAFYGVMETGIDPPVVHRAVFTPEGGFRTFRFDRNLIRTPEGRPSGMRLILTDVTEQQLELERERKARMWLESISDSMYESVIVTDVLGFVRFANLAAEKLTGWTAAELTRTTLQKCIPILSFLPTDGVTFNPRRILEHRTFGIATVLNKEREAMKIFLNTSPITDKSEGTTIGVVYVMRKAEGITQED